MQVVALRGGYSCFEGLEFTMKHWINDDKSRSFAQLRLAVI